MRHQFDGRFGPVLCEQMLHHRTGFVLMAQAIGDRFADGLASEHGQTGQATGHRPLPHAGRQSHRRLVQEPACTQDQRTHLPVGQQQIAVVQVAVGESQPFAQPLRYVPTRPGNERTAVGTMLAMRRTSAGARSPLPTTEASCPRVTASLARGMLSDAPWCARTWRGNSAQHSRRQLRHATRARRMCKPAGTERSACVGTSRQGGLDRAPAL